MGKSLYSKRKQAKREKLAERFPEVTCRDCRKKFLSKDVYKGFCPFVDEVYGHKAAKKVGEVLLCSDCYQERVWDV
jgi:hypothetical protein